MAKQLGADRKRSSASLPEAFGAELTERRTKAGWSQQVLAEILGCDINYIGQIERAEKSPTLGILIGISTVFRTQLSEFLQAAEERVLKSRSY